MKKIDDLERSIEKRLSDVNSFNNSNNNSKEKIQNFKDRNNKSKRKDEKYETINTVLNSFDTIVIIATTFSSITLSLTGIGLIVLPKPTATACELSIGNKVVYEIDMQKNNKYKKVCEKDQQTIKSFDKLYRKRLQDNETVKKGYECLCNIFAKYVDETKNESFFLKMNIKIKLNVFNNNKFKFQTRN